MKSALILTIGLAAAAALPATAAAATPGKTVYDVVKASGTERVTFSADTATCAQFVTCGFGGSVNYTFGGTPSGRLVLNQSRSGRISGSAAFGSHGTTVSDVTSGAVCQDTVRHKREEFSIDSRTPRGRLLFGLHGGKTDYLATDCAGPSEAALAHDHALPSGKFKHNAFNALHTAIGLQGTASFREAGYVGKVTWKLKYRVKRR